jgi:hypothetical protein
MAHFSSFFATKQNSNKATERQSTKTVFEGQPTCSVLVYKQLGNWHAHDVTAAQDHGIGATDLL